MSHRFFSRVAVKTVKHFSLLLSNPKIRLIIQWTIVGVIIFFLARTLWNNWIQLKETYWQFRAVPLIVATVLLFSGNLLSVLLWKLGLGLSSKTKPSFTATYSIINISNLGRYVPGKVWQFLGIFWLSKKADIKEGQTVVAVIIAEVTQKVSALIFGLVFLNYFLPNATYQTLALAFLAVGLIVLHPRFLNIVANLFTKKTKREKINLRFKYTTIFAFLVLNAGVWSINGIAFYFFADSLTELDIRYLPLFLLVLPVAWTVGWLAVFSPAGLGVREGAMTFLLGYHLPMELAILIALISRVWFTLVEIACGLIALYIYKRRFSTYAQDSLPAD